MNFHRIGKALVRRGKNYLLKKYGITERFAKLTDQLQLVQQELNNIQSEKTYHQEVAEWHTKTLSFLAETQVMLFSKPEISAASNLPLVSVIMPTWNRQAYVQEAIDSLLAQAYPLWELLIIDDGSTDQTKQIIERYLTDPRISYYYQEHAGHSVARNLGLANSQGAFIAYLDSDNLWYPYLLTVIVNAFIADPACQAIYFGAIRKEFIAEKKWVDFRVKFNYEEVIGQGKYTSAYGIDLNCFVHQRVLYEQRGGFDVSLKRLADYEFTYRYLKQTQAKLIPVIGTYYRFCIAENSVTLMENQWYNLYRIRASFKRPLLKEPLRVLYVLSNFPQITETYMDGEIDYMQRQGVEIEVWSPASGVSPYSTTMPIHRGTLTDAIKIARPHVVHSHWLHTALSCAQEVAQAGLRLTVRGHGFDFASDILQKLQQDSAVYAVYVFNHFKVGVGSELTKVKTLPVCFNPNRYSPCKEKNKKLVFRVSTALPAKDLQLFMRVAARCQQHRFVLVVGHTNSHMNYADELIQYNQTLGNPVELYTNLSAPEVESLMHQAGIYLHTCLLETEGGRPYGMPISICEAMATGTYVIGKHSAAAEAYIGNAAQCYRNEDEAVQLIQATLTWSDEDWLQQQNQAIDRAYQYFSDDCILPTVLQDWLAIKALESQRLYLEKMDIANSVCSEVC